MYCKTKGTTLRLVTALFVLVALVAGVSSSALADEYKVIDSNGTSNPAFTFEDISTTGTDITNQFSNSDDSAVAVSLPFNFTLYGQTYSKVYVSTNGFVTFSPDDAEEYWNEPIPNSDLPNAAAYTLWDDLYLQNNTKVSYAMLGSGANSRFIVQWTGIGTYDNHGEGGPGSATFQVVLYRQGGQVVMRYKDVSFTYSSDHSGGADATVGIENADGTEGIQYSYDEAALSNGLGILFYRRVIAPTPPELRFNGSTAGTLTSTSAVTLVPVQVVPGSSSVTVLTLSADGQVVATSTSQGTFDVPVALADGEYDLSGHLVDGNGLTSDASTHLIVDTHAPDVEVSGADTVVRSSSVDVAGTAHDAVSGVQSVLVNGTPTTLYVDGSFSSTVDLKKGKNYVDVQATDELGNNATTTYCYDYEPTTAINHSVTVTLLLSKKDINVDGSWQTGEAAPMLYKGKVFLPAKEVLQLAGGTFHYADGKATLSLNGRTITLGLGANGGTIQSGVYYAPLEVLRDQLGLDISWDTSSQTISFTYWP